jgi:hypothetical protein
MGFPVSHWTVFTNERRQRRRRRRKGVPKGIRYQTEKRLPTPLSRVLPEKLTGPQLVKKCHVFYG